MVINILKFLSFALLLLERREITIVYLTEVNKIPNSPFLSDINALLLQLAEINESACILSDCLY